MGNANTRYYSTPPKVSKKKKPAGSGGNAPKVEKPKATEKQLNKVLCVTDVDFHFLENTEEHNTDRFECTVQREDIGYGSLPELVLRRGQPFKVTLTFNREFSLEHDDMRVLLTSGKRPQIYKAAFGNVLLDESGKSVFKYDEWGAKLLKKEKNTALIQINIPCDCAIGYWKLRVLTKSKLKKGEKTKQYMWTCKDEIKILFNPWCKDDDVYMESQDQRDEYILNDAGAVWRGNDMWPKPKKWGYDQFDDSVLDTSIFLIMKCFKEGQRHLMSKPVPVARAISQVINSNDSDKGVLCGKWSGGYADGENPGFWDSSKQILEKYMSSNGERVKYGQCWVFSALVTTVCRALGIPACSITNYSSAHDANKDHVITHTKKRNEEGDLETCGGGDSVWNYHLWNNVWMKRPDLKEYDGKYDGWQAIDATPQERADGVFKCGPAPVAAIKAGDVGVPYETGFVFAEANADRVYLELLANGKYKILKVKTDAVGVKMSTKKADGKPLKVGLFGQGNREDIEHMYKHPEGSPESRAAVLRAMSGAKKKSVYLQEHKMAKQDIQFKMKTPETTPLRKSVEVILTAENTSDNLRHLKHVTFTFHPSQYTGEVGKRFKRDRQEINEELVPNKVYTYKATVTAKEYLDQLDENRAMCVRCTADVDKTSTRPLQTSLKEHTVIFQEPELKVQMPKKVKVGEKFEASFTLQNPMDEKLTNCEAIYRARGHKVITPVTIDDAPVGGTTESKFTLTAKRKGNLTVGFTFNSKQLWYLSAAESVLVE